MAITGVSAISGQQIIAAGAVSAKNAAMDSNGGYLTAKLTKASADTLYQPIGNYQTAGNYLTTGDSANFYTTANESGFITGVDLSPYQEKTAMTAYQPVGDYMMADALTGVSSTWNTVTDKLDRTAFSTVSGDFLTAHQSLADYQTTADMINYQTTAAMTAYLTAVPDTYLQNTDLATSDGKVTAISGIPLSAGGSVPEGVMVESGLEYNAVNEISGYNGSAIAQYGAEKQWLQHDDTLLHVANSAQYALGVNVSAVAQLLGIDETVLYEGTYNTATRSIQLNEPLSSFESIKVLWAHQSDTCRKWAEFDNTNTYWFENIGRINTDNGQLYTMTACWRPTDNLLSANYVRGYYAAATTAKAWTINNADINEVIPVKVIGIGRKEV